MSLHLPSSVCTYTLSVLGRCRIRLYFERSRRSSGGGQESAHSVGPALMEGLVIALRLVLAGRLDLRAGVTGYHSSENRSEVCATARARLAP